ncbi:MAG: T9SS type A sorting domain-containing protein, partial [Saprospiraceae bacterium]
DFSVYNAVGQQLFTAKNTNRLDASRLSAGTYIIRDVKRGVSQLFIKQ